MKAAFVSFFAVLLTAMLFFTTALNALVTDPVLTLNTAMHTLRVGKISTDAQNRIVLTVSNDKSAKLWDAKSGALLKTLRIPIGEGNDGMLYSGSLSPDGKVAAVGGWIGKDGLSTSIFFFDVVSGTMIHSITGLPNIVNDLQFSFDGKYLAAALGSGEGLKIYTCQNGMWNAASTKLQSTLGGYTGTAYYVAWDRSNRLVSCSSDGTLRLYNNRFELLKQNSSLAGKEPFTVAITGSGTYIAAGFLDTNVIEVYDGQSLQKLYEPDVSGLLDDQSPLHAVAFSKDESKLFAGGHHSKHYETRWWNQLRIWQNAGRGVYNDYHASKGAIIDVKPLNDGSIMYCSYTPDWGIMSPDGKFPVYSSSEIFSFANKDKNHFKIANNGNRIGVGPSYENPVQFDIRNRSYQAIALTEGMIPNTTGGQINLTDWDNKTNPKLNGRDLSFWNKGERSFSADVSNDSQIAAIGSAYNLYCLNSKGELLWSKATQGTAWCVNISENNKAVVTAISDGTIRWYRLSDGKHLLSLYLHPDRKQWVLWTPQGYYDCSGGSENLIGWHLNQGQNSEAYFYPASKFRNKYYRPDVIDNILVSYDEDNAIRIANLESNRKQNEQSVQNSLPPIVRIHSPHHLQEFSSDKVTLEYSLSSPGGEAINNIRFMIDGRPVETERALQKVNPQGTLQKELTVPRKDVSIQILAENKNGWSSPAQVSLRYKGSIKADPDVLKPSLYVLAIGVSEYQNPDYRLAYAAKDARDFGTAISNQKGGLYKDVIVRTLTDANANKDNILDALEWIQSETTSRDMAMIFLAGHGINDNSGTFYYMPYEANVESLRRSCLMFTELKHTASNIPGKVLMFVDACHSGNVWGNRRSAPDVNALVNELSDAESGAVVFTSSTGKQFSLEDPKWGNGAFTKALIEGMNGSADLFGNGSITIKSLDAYIAQKVKELTGGKQAPTAVIPQSIPDFPIAIKRK